MPPQIPGELFSQFHSGFKIAFAHVPGAGLRVCIEDPKRRIFLSFRIEKENESKLHDCLCQPLREGTEPGVSQGQRLADDDLGDGCSSA